MIIPFVFTMSTYREAPYTWFYLKGVDMVKRHGWPVIGQEIYVNSSLSDLIKLGEHAAYDKEFVDKYFWYDIPKAKEVKKVPKYAIKQEIIEKLAEEKGSYMDAYLSLLREPYQPLVDLICSYIEDIRKKYKEPIEAFCVLCHNSSLSAAAAKYNIPVIHYEMGCFREPAYMKTGFFDFKSLHGGDTAETRYKKFLSEMKNDNRLFSDKELLALMLRPETMNMLDKFGTKPVKKCGAALGYTIVELFMAQSHFLDSELLYRISRKYGAENMLIRSHPSDPYRARYPQYGKYYDKSGNTTIDFILSCEEIFSIGSNVCIEAMFWGRKAHTIVKSPSYCGSAHTVEEKGLRAEKEYLNFFALNYLIPFEFVMDPEYARWRLTDPSEKEIFEKHLAVHLKNKNLTADVIGLKGNKRLEALKAAQAIY